MAPPSLKIMSLGLLVLLVSSLIAEATPPGIAKEPKRVKCMNPKYKHCNNLEHVCPKFCPDGICHVNCRSCKPICGPGPDDSDSSPSPPPPQSSSPPYPTPSPPQSPPPRSPTPPPPKSPPSPYPTPSPPRSPPPPTPTPPTPSPPRSPPPKTPSPPQSPPPTTPTPPTPSPPLSPPPPPPKTPSPPQSPPPPTPSPPRSPPPPKTPSTPPSTPPVSSPPPQSPPPKTPSTPPSTPPPSQSPPPSTPPSTPPVTPPTSPSPPPPQVPTPPSTPPPPSTSGQKRVRCKNKKYAQCYAQAHVCPTNCPTTCEVDCVTCKPVCSCDFPGAVCQDPRFIGGDGITFYFHGKKNKDFCIMSDPNLHINAHFIGKTNTNMTRDFTWVQSIGILFDDHKLFIGARKTSKWDNAVDRLALAFDGLPIFLQETEGSTWRSTTKPMVSISRTQTTNDIVLEVEGNFKITAKVVPITEKESKVHNYGITEEDCFAHLDLGFKFYSLSRKVDGVLGRTYRDDYVSKAKMGIAMPVLGGEADFVTTSLFKPDCSVAQFHGESVKEEDSFVDLSSLSCASGMDGSGVVCKR